MALPSMSRGVLEAKEDSELIRRYLTRKDGKAFEVLIRRYYNVNFKRFLKYTKSEDDAHDLSQQLWLRIIKGLNNYSEQGKFVNYLSASATNVLKDFWRSSSDFKGVDEEDMSQLPSDYDLSKRHETQQAIGILTTELIPELPVNLRLVYLLKHESEYWEGQHPLRWHHLAELNGTDVRTAGSYFEKARNKLVNNTNRVVPEEDLSDEEKLFFLVWTQAQRPNKNKRFTEEYYARLLDIPVNTLKTRYRAALKQLRKGLEQWQ